MIVAVCCIAEITNQRTRCTSLRKRCDAERIELARLRREVSELEERALGDAVLEGSQQVRTFHVGIWHIRRRRICI
jgi:hypothetical protein